MRINEILGEWLIMPQSIKPMGLVHKKGIGPNNRFDFKNKNNNKANEDENSVARVLGKAEASLMHGLDMAQNIIKKEYGMAEVQAKVIAENWPPLIDTIKNIYKTSETVKEDERTASAQAAIWRKSNPIGNNFMNPTDYDSDAPGTHIIMDNPTELHFYKVPAENYDKAFDLWLDNKSGDNPRDNQYYDSTKDYASDHQYWGRIAPEDDQMNWPDAQPQEDAPPGREKQVKALKGKVDNPYAVAWASYNKSKKKK